MHRPIKVMLAEEILLIKFLLIIGHKWKKIINNKNENFQNRPNMTFYGLKLLFLAYFPQKLVNSGEVQWIPGVDFSPETR